MKYIIVDKAGHQVSSPKDDDQELWDRVDSLDPNGVKGYHVVAYTKLKESLQELDEAISSGVYSVMKDEWIQRPTKLIGEQPKVDDQVAKLVDRANKCKDIESIDSFLDDVYKLRQEGLLKDGEMSEGNLIFKELRLKDIIKKLKDNRVTLVNNLMSLR